ncbi:hypothetical protein TNCV_1540891 [Trichonephila clavipes]|nr:hypothetical protein TNCV_1540891 [Trichonephila clavipes]
MMWFASGEFPFGVRSLRRFKTSLLSASEIRGRRLFLVSRYTLLVVGMGFSWVKGLRGRSKADHEIILKCRCKCPCGDPQRRRFRAAWREMLHCFIVSPKKREELMVRGLIILTIGQVKRTALELFEFSQHADNTTLNHYSFFLH